MGDPGTNALSPAPTDGPRKIINLDLESTPPIDLSIYFTGGKDTITYSVEVTTPEDGMIPAGAGITLEDVSGSMPPLKVTEIAADATDGFDPIVLTVTATDADMRSAMNMVTVKRNNTPSFTGTIESTEVGVQEGARTGATDCDMLNVCVVSGFDDADVGDAEKLIYSINTDVVSVSATEMAGEVKITGMTATTEAVMVKITAMDEGGLTVDSNEFSLTVNAAPTVKRAIAPVRLPSRGTADEKMVSFIIDSHFEDSDNLEFALVIDEEKAHDGEVATVVVTDGGTSNSSVTVTAQGAGRTMVYVTATEETGGADTGIGQSVEASFMVTVD